MPRWVLGKRARSTAETTQLRRDEPPPEAWALDTRPLPPILILTLTVPEPPCFSPHEVTWPRTRPMPLEMSLRVRVSGRFDELPPEPPLDRRLRYFLQHALSGSTRHATSSQPPEVASATGSRRTG